MEFSGTQHSAVVDFLRNVTSQDPAVQKRNLNDLERLAQWDGAAYALIEVLCCDKQTAAIRQAAALVMKQLCRKVESFTDAIDLSIVEMALLSSLGDPSAEVRRGAALVVSDILKRRGLDGWPSLLNVLWESTQPAVGLSSTAMWTSESTRDGCRALGTAECLKILLDSSVSSMQSAISSEGHCQMFCSLLLNLVRHPSTVVLCAGLSTVSRAIQTELFPSYGVAPCMDDDTGTASDLHHSPPVTEAMRWGQTCDVSRSSTDESLSQNAQLLINYCCGYILSIGSLLLASMGLRGDSDMHSCGRVGNSSSVEGKQMIVILLEFLISVQGYWGPSVSRLAEWLLPLVEEDIGMHSISGKQMNEERVTVEVSLIAELVQGGGECCSLIGSRLPHLLAAFQASCRLTPSCTLLVHHSENDAGKPDRSSDVLGVYSTRRLCPTIPGAPQYQMSENGDSYGTDEDSKEAATHKNDGLADSDTPLRAAAQWSMSCFATYCPDRLVECGVPTWTPLLNRVEKRFSQQIPYDQLSHTAPPGTLANCSSVSEAGTSESPQLSGWLENAWWLEVESVMFLIAEVVDELFELLPVEFCDSLWRTIRVLLLSNANYGGGYVAPFFVRRQAIRCASRFVSGLVGSRSVESRQPMLERREDHAARKCATMNEFVSMFLITSMDSCKAVQCASIQFFTSTILCALGSGTCALESSSEDDSEEGEKYDDDDPPEEEAIHPPPSTEGDSRHVNGVRQSHLIDVYTHLARTLKHYQLRQRISAYSLFSTLAPRDASSDISAFPVVAHDVVGALIECCKSAASYSSTDESYQEVASILNTLCELLPFGIRHHMAIHSDLLFEVCTVLYRQIALQLDQHSKAQSIHEGDDSRVRATGVEEDICTLAVDVMGSFCDQIASEGELLGLAVPCSPDFQKHVNALRDTVVRTRALELAMSALSGTRTSGTEVGSSRCLTASTPAALQQACFGLLSSLLIVDRFLPFIHLTVPAVPTERLSMYDILLRMCWAHIEFKSVHWIKQMRRSTSTDVNDYGDFDMASSTLHGSPDSHVWSNALLCLAKMLFRCEGSAENFSQMAPSMGANDISKLIAVVIAAVSACSSSDPLHVEEQQQDNAIWLPETMRINLLYAAIGLASVFSEHAHLQHLNIFVTLLNFLTANIPNVLEEVELAQILLGLGLYLHRNSGSLLLGKQQYLVSVAKPASHLVRVESDAALRILLPVWAPILSTLLHNANVSKLARSRVSKAEWRHLRIIHAKAQAHAQ